MPTILYNRSDLTQKRIFLRKSQTFQEKLLWNEIRNSKLGIKFKRQFSIGGFIVDFYCQQKNLAIEIDGGVHNKTETKSYDKDRTKYLNSIGIKVIRFWNSEIENSIDDVIGRIKLFLE